MWQIIHPLEPEFEGPDEPRTISTRRLAASLLGLTAIIVAGGVTLATTGEVIVQETGLAAGIIGFLFVAIATSLPEASAIVGAMRHRRYELAVGEIFGSNMFNLAIILVIDLAAGGPPVLSLAGDFEMAAAMLALVMTGIFVLGLIERRDRTVLRMGQDSIAAICLYLFGLALLLSLAA